MRAKYAKRCRYGGKLFRSMAEANFAQHLDSRDINWEYEVGKYIWVPPVTRSVYTPDFRIWIAPDEFFEIEGKGRLTAQDKRKMIAIRKAHPKADIRFVFWDAYRKLSKRSKKQYWQWAEEQGYKWSHRIIPNEWLKPGTTKWG